MPPYLVYATAAVIVLLVALAGLPPDLRPVRADLAVPDRIIQVYVVQAITYREYGLRRRGAGPGVRRRPAGPLGVAVVPGWCITAVRSADRREAAAATVRRGRPRRSAW